MRVVISQSMLFPWVGMLEQIRLADIFVHYDDVQFSKGGFGNRVQVKTPLGVRWMTIPLHNLHLGQSIKEVGIKPTSEWRDQHMRLLESSFFEAPHARDALDLAESVYAPTYASVGELSRASVLALAAYFGIDASTRFVDVEQLCLGGSGSERVLDIVRRLEGSQYITGHGAARYLDHTAFERENISVEYMDYRCVPYPQGHGAFTPYVTALDLVANCGRAGAKYICSGTIPWREYFDGPR
jgi:hypothetical protein